MGSPGVGGSLSAASDVLLDNPANNQVLKRDGGYWKNLADEGGASGGEMQASLVIVRPVKGSANSIGAYCREHGQLTTNTNPATVIQAAIDHASNYVGSTGHTGGEVKIAAGRYNISTPIVGRAVDIGASPNVWPIVLAGEGGLNGAPAIWSAPAGTALIWNGGSAPSGGGAVVNLSNDCHGYKVKEITISGNGVATYCGKSAGRGIEWWSCRFLRMSSSGVGLWITNGTDTSHDRYVQQRIMFCRAEGETSGRGFLVQNSLGGNGCTDGRVRDVQTNGCDDGGLDIQQGGWSVNGGHITGSGGASGQYDMRIGSGFTHITNVYFDTIGGGPNLIIDSNNVTVTNCFFITNSKASNNTYDCISAGGSSAVTIMGNTWGGGTASCRYFFNGQSNGTIVMGNTGPSSSLGTSIVPAGYGGQNIGNVAI